MKRTVAIGLTLATIVATISFISYEYLTKKQNYEKYKIMPSVSFLTLYNQKQNLSNLSQYKGYVVQVFNPGCEACQEEATDYFSNNDSLQNILFLMLSMDSLTKIKDFAQRQMLYNANNFMFGRIDTVEFEYHFGSTPIPTLFIYNSDKKLITKTRIANSTTILKYFKN